MEAYMHPDEFRKYATGHLGLNSLTLHDYMTQANRQAATVPQIYGLTPNIIEERQLNVIAMDVFSRLMMDRIIFLGMGINDQVANIVSAQLLFLQSADAKKDISIYLNSPGGSVYAGLGIYDTMQIVSPDVATICTGMAASMGAVLLCAGAAGKRSALPHSRVMIHQPMGGAQGQASDIEIAYKQIQIVKDELYQIIATHSNQPFDKVWADSDRDYWMTAPEAKEYGLVDEVLGRKKEPESK
ncbi:MAG: ATP-dependent Clp endopeptidase proteolytic subunit ClpP [Bacteroidia bacterium]|nr:ATP-dependent Clp endopeptidase proteolytic subunit ClpP [Bacteroidia bacterium]